MTKNNPWVLDGRPINSHLLLGTALYPSPDSMLSSIQNSHADIITVSLRRQSPENNGGQDFWKLLQGLNLNLLPNTAGCRTAQEAITLAEMSRELFETNWIKLEVIGDDYTLQPDPIELVQAAKILTEKGFTVFPYTTDDLVIAQRLQDAGCQIIMPWAAPIGSGQGLRNIKALETMRSRLPNATLIIDAGIGKPSEAARVMELGFDAVLLNSAVALAHHPVEMAQAFAKAIEAGREAYLAGCMPVRDFASPSTPVVGQPFWHQENYAQLAK